MWYAWFLIMLYAWFLIMLHTMGTRKLMVVASTFHVTGVIFHNVRHQGWLHSKHDSTLRVIAHTFHVMCMNFHNGWLHVHPQWWISIMGGRTFTLCWRPPLVSHYEKSRPPHGKCVRPPLMREFIRNNTHHNEITCDYPYIYTPE